MVLTWLKSGKSGGGWLVCALVGLVLSCGSETPTEAGSQRDVGADVDAGVTDSMPPDALDAAEDEARPDGPDGAEDEDLPLDPNRIAPRFEPDGEGFFRMPWPSDYRLSEDGHPDLSDFPERYSGVIDLFLSAIEAEVVGFGTVPVIYVGFDRPLDAEAMPMPAESLLSDSPIRLIAVDSERCGQPVPIVVTFHIEGDRFRDDNVLTAVPVPGFVLEPSTPYALLVRRDIPAAVPGVVEAATEFRAVLDGVSAREGLEDTFAPLLECAAEAGIDLGALAVATVFTTQDPVGELREIVTFVLDPAAVSDPEITGFGPLEGAGRDAYKGTYQTPIFQRGDPPYAVEGGGFRFAEDGTPIIQRWESVDFVVSLPEGAAGPFPILLWEDGTGAEVTDFLRNRSWMPVAYEHGFAIASFEQPFVGSRAVPGGDPGMTSSVLNPEGARTTPRQQVVDTAYFLRVLSAVGATYPELDLDPERVVFGGQSQGANIGAIAAGAVPDIAAYALNGVGGYLTYSILDRATEPSIVGLVAAALRIPEEQLTPVHAVLAVLQMGGDTTDPLNYAASWTGWGGHSAGSHVFLINGYNDPYVPPSVSGALVVAGDAAPLGEPGWDVDPYGVWDQSPLDPPVSGNRVSAGGRALTIVSLLDPSTGHYTVYDRREVAAATGLFWAGAFDGAPTADVE